ncbi:MAG: NUDIX hydrolase [Pseudolabrys sp.]|jgi:ADP-ribose pyrophosphatase
MTDKIVDKIVDLPADADIGEPEILAKGYRDLLRYHVTLRGPHHAPIQQQRDVIVSTGTVAVLPIDLQRDEIVLIRQFRLAAHLANGAGEMIEIVAGGVDAGEDAATAARRECREEIGVEPTALAEIMTFMTTPGIAVESVVLFVAAIDASRVPSRSGLAGEGEQIETLRVPIDRALRIVDGGGVRNGPMILALQWLALNRARLRDILKA